MSGSIYGKNFCISTWGESHGKALGVVVDGCPAGISLTPEEIQKELDKRRPGVSHYTTARSESDSVEIMSGIFGGKTTGAPISLLVYNTDQRSHDYSQIADTYRPGHADFTFDQKYGFRDYRGGGRSSGRETIARVAAGAIAKKILTELQISIFAYTESIGPVSIQPERFAKEEMANNALGMPDAVAASQARIFLDGRMQEKDSTGGVVACKITGMPAGVGEPVFHKLDALLAQALFSIGAVKGLEFGSGFSAARSSGSQNNDPFQLDRNGAICKTTNHSGGILGGISDGGEIFFRIAIKPTPSIAKDQQTVTRDGRPTVISIHGRHDPIILPRALVVIESMAAITLVDLLLQNMLSKMDGIKQFYANRS